MMNSFRPIHIKLTGLYFLESEKLTDVKTFLTRTEIITFDTDLDEYYRGLIEILNRKTQEFAERDSVNYLLKIIIFYVNLLYTIKDGRRYSFYAYTSIKQA